jgi:TonB family protein
VRALLLAPLLLAPLVGVVTPVAHAQAPPATGVLTRPPALLQFVEATLPEADLGRTGSVVLAVTIRADGTVEDAVVTEPSGPSFGEPPVDAAAFEAAAVDAVRRFVFSPAEVDGVPTRIRILYRYDFVARVVAPTTAVFEGVVRDRAAKVPLPGVTVTLGDGRFVVTDADGRFTFADVAAGPTRVTLEGDRLTALSTEETFVAGERLDATYDVFLAEPGEDGDDLEILVTAPAIKRQAVSTEIAADEARKVPGTQGDVLKVVENLPGVARASLGTGALVVWGAAPDDTGVYVDGVPVPRLYHDGGIRSVIGSDLVRSVELVPGGYGAAYGRGLGGLVSVETNRFGEGTHGSVSADVYDASASLNGPIGARVNYGIAGRYGYVGPLLGAFYPGVEDYFPVPHYYDLQGRVGVALGPNETVEVTTLVSSDRTERTAPNADPAREASERKDLTFQRVYARYTHDVGDGTTVSALVYGGADQSAQVARFGAVETALRADVALLGARGSYRTRLTSFFTVEGGLDALATQTDVTREGSVAAPAREGDVRVFGQPPPDQIASDRYRVIAVNVAPYAEADLALLGDTLHIVPGARIDPYARSVSRATPQEGNSPTHGVHSADLRVEPRLSVRYDPSERIGVTGAFGLYGQPASATDLSASFGNPTLPASEGAHGVLGLSARPIDPLTIEVTGFYTASEGLAVRNGADQPARAEALVATGVGRTYGGQAMVRLERTRGAYGWLSYTLSWSERRDAPELDWRPSDYDQRHVLTALGGYELPFGLEAAARVRVSTGFPRTEVVGAYYDDRRDLYQPVFGDHNAIRIPTFFQGDVRVAKDFTLGSSTLELSLEVQNVTNRANVEEFIYDADYTTRGAISGLPILPVLGVRWSF